MTDPIVQRIVAKLYGPAEPDLSPEMAESAKAAARAALDVACGTEAWVEKFATGDEETDRPLWREYKRTALLHLADLAVELARTLDQAR